MFVVLLEKIKKCISINVKFVINDIPSIERIVNQSHFKFLLKYLERKRIQKFNFFKNFNCGD